MEDKILKMIFFILQPAQGIEEGRLNESDSKTGRSSL
jgi:hypothetical protein